MKILFSILIAIISSGAMAQRAVQCEMVNQVNERIVDRGGYTLETDQTQLLLLSYGYITGAVRDSVTQNSGERKLQFKLSYQLGGEHGTAVGATTYKVDQAPGELIKATLEEPTFGTPITLRCHLVENSSAHIQGITYVYGNGNHGGFCNSRNSYFCVDQIKRQSNDRATMDASTQCRIRNGTPDPFPTCNDSCTPFLIPDDGLEHYVSCQSNCNLRCTVP